VLPPAGDLDRRLKELGRRTLTRFTIMAPDGVVLADSDHDPAGMDNHASRPEMEAALAGGTGRSTRFSDTLRRRMLYLAVPVQRAGRVVAVVRAATPLTGLEAAVRSAQESLWLAGVLALGLAAAMSFVLARRIVRPLEDIRRAADRFARGDLAARAPIPPSTEPAALARTFNQMAEELDQRMRTILAQRNEQEAVLASMHEAVIAVDSRERVLNVNPAACRLLGTTVAGARGRSLPEIVRNPELAELVARVLEKAEGAEGEFVLRGESDCYLQMHGSVLRDAAGTPIGALIVLNDVTRLKRLEQARREFVANASHELKTPITSLKGYLETLADGAGTTPEEARRFLGIMSRQAERLEAIVEDLLRLSRIEHDGERGAVALAPGDVAAVLESAVQLCAPAAREKRIPLELECAPGLRAALNAPLLEQAVANLVDNAIKYSDPGKRVVVRAAAEESGVAIRVTDQGCGIEKKHLPRIFERFYRVDAARSRSLGGTGLGLAIARHIVLAHSGRIAVESTPEIGSTFSIHLPRLG
jgi:two-component system phosphate regulon sensor histidine kinase PhoR